MGTLSLTQLMNLVEMELQLNYHRAARYGHVEEYVTIAAGQRRRHATADGPVRARHDFARTARAGARRQAIARDRDPGGQAPSPPDRFSGAGGPGFAVLLIPTSL